MKRGVVLSVVLILFASMVACKRDTKYGSEDLTKKVKGGEKEAATRLGEFIKSPQPTAEASPAALGAGESPSPVAPEYHDLTLTNDHPFYQPNPNMALKVGTIMRILNKDDNPRRFLSEDGRYDSGDIAPGQTKEITLKVKGDFPIGDPHVPFATAFLQVY